MSIIYTTVLKSIGFSYQEFKTACRLKLKGKTEAQIIGMSIEENVFMVKTESRRKEFASRIVERVLMLDDTLVTMVADGSVDIGKQIAFYVIMKRDSLLFEFMIEVYRDKLISGDMLLTEKDFNVFFSRKAEQSEQVAAWTDYTIYKMTQVIKRVLKESGLVKVQRKEIILQPPLLDAALLEHIRSLGDIKYLEVMTGVKS